MRATDHYYYRSRRFNYAALGGGDPSWILSSGGDGAELDIDFVNDRAWNRPSQVSIASLLTCTRASTGYYTKADGTLQSFSSNVLRYGTNGLLVEEARTNLLTQSSDPSQWAALGNATIAATNIDAPDLTTTAARVAPDATNNNHYVRSLNSPTLTSGQNYTASWFIRADNHSLVSLSVSGAGVGLYYVATFNLSNGTVTQTGSAGGANLVAASVSAYADGWYRLVVTGNINATEDGFVWLSLSETGTPSYTVFGLSGAFSTTGAETIDAWAPQLEAGSFPTSYIPTTSSSATRAADVVVLGGSPFVSAYNQAAGAVVVYVKRGAYVSSQLAIVINASGSMNDSFFIDFVVDSTTSRLFSFDDGGVQVSLTSGAIDPPGTLNELAFAYEINNVSFVAEGSVVGTDTSCTMPTADQFMLGGNGSSNMLNGYIQRFAYWNTRLSNSALQALTT